MSVADVTVWAVAVLLAYAAAGRLVVPVVVWVGDRIAEWLERPRRDR